MTGSKRFFKSISSLNPIINASTAYLEDDEIDHRVMNQMIYDSLKRLKMKKLIVIFDDIDRISDESVETKNLINKFLCYSIRFNNVITITCADMGKLLSGYEEKKDFYYKLFNLKIAIPRITSQFNLVEYFINDIKSKMIVYSKLKPFQHQEDEKLLKDLEKYLLIQREKFYDIFSTYREIKIAVNNFFIKLDQIRLFRVDSSISSMISNLHSILWLSILYAIDIDHYEMLRMKAELNEFEVFEEDVKNNKEKKYYSKIIDVFLNMGLLNGLNPFKKNEHIEETNNIIFVVDEYIPEIIFYFQPTLNDFELTISEIYECINGKKSIFSLLAMKKFAGVYEKKVRLISFLTVFVSLTNDISKIEIIKRTLIAIIKIAFIRLKGEEDWSDYFREFAREYINVIRQLLAQRDGDQQNKITYSIGVEIIKHILKSILSDSKYGMELSGVFIREVNPLYNYDHFLYPVIFLFGDEEKRSKYSAKVTERNELLSDLGWDFYSQLYFIFRVLSCEAKHFLTPSNFSHEWYHEYLESTINFLKNISTKDLFVLDNELIGELNLIYKDTFRYFDLVCRNMKCTKEQEIFVELAHQIRLKDIHRKME